MEQEPVRSAIRTGQTVVTHYPETNADMSGPALAQGYHTLAVLPLRNDQVVLGVLNVYSNQRNYITPDRLQVLEALANIVAVALARARLFEQVQQGSERLQVLSQRLVEVQEVERRHIARELHDEIGQNLGAVKIDLQTLYNLPGLESVAPHLAEISNLVDRTLQQVRTLSVELRPAVLDDLGLAPALRWYLDRQAQRGGFAVHFMADPLEARLAAELETVCFRLVQEAVTNISRYAQAQHVEVELRHDGAILELTIWDDGIGFEVAAALERVAQGASLGLLSMQERVRLVGGQLDLKSGLQTGTEIQARLPLRYAGRN
jgi:signal transduction histidine kinase